MHVVLESGKPPSLHLCGNSFSNIDMLVSNVTDNFDNLSKYNIPHDLEYHHVQRSDRLHYKKHTIIFTCPRHRDISKTEQTFKLKSF